MGKVGSAVLLAISSVVGLYLGEILVQAIDLHRFRGRIAAAGSSLEKVLELRASGTDAWPTVHPRGFICRKPWDDVMGRCGERPAAERGLVVEGRRILPLAGIAGVSTVYCREAGPWAIYPADRHGFNNPDTLWEQPPAAVVVVGDSFVHGACVESGSGLVDRIREAFPRTLNLGYGGHGPLSMLAAIREYASPLAPADVLWVFFGNDLRLDLPIEMEVPVLAGYLEAGTRQELARIPRSTLDDALKASAGPALAEAAETSRHRVALLGREALIRLSEVPRLGGVRRFLGSRFLASGEAEDESGEDLSAVPGWPRFEPLLERILAAARDTVARWGGRLHFIYLPDHHELFRFLADRPKAERARKIHERVLGMAEGLGIPVLDLLPPLADGNDPETLIAFTGTYWGHYTPEGYRRLATAIVAHLRSSRQKGIDGRGDSSEQ